MVNAVATGKMAPQQGVQPAVLYKLILFAILMAVVPIGTYFGSLNYMWNGSTTYSAISAVVTANIVLVGYVVVAFEEEAAYNTTPAPPLLRKKEQ
ncbi:VMA21-like domain-containing protein [Dioszegia hungarica]|uniref:VMA21-like domain-containing protein n=1 Tax=Dioszegia hungarica TaxID=4972 RepID=A0AA38HB47_9TREE|nr:VMA21-like domain-containing protein [Dioszegia hungarica]KAI9635739.1 VMA21-like domain-containing protein [Dioszegia hungarica]